MDWIRKNKFLAGFLGFVVLVAGALGYLLFTQMSTYDQTSQDYEAAVKERDRLQGLKPFPFQKSKVKLIDLRKETAEKVTELQQNLANYEPPAERADFKPIDFQDKLRRVVEEITQAAAGANVKLPADFYMGFEQYRGTPPDATAAPALSRELDAIQDLLRILINRRIDALTSIKRAPLPQEPGANSAQTAAKPTAPGGKPAAAAPADSVSRYPVDVAFSGQNTAFRDALNDLVTSKRFFLVRAIQVKNQQQKGPPRESPGGQPTAAASTGAAAPSPGTPGAADAASTAPAASTTFEYIVGLEKVDVDMRIEIVKVAPPVATAAR